METNNVLERELSLGDRQDTCTQHQVTDSHPASLGALQMALWPPRSLEGLQQPSTHLKQ